MVVSTTMNFTDFRSTLFEIYTKAAAMAPPKWKTMFGLTVFGTIVRILLHFWGPKLLGLVCMLMASASIGIEYWYSNVKGEDDFYFLIALFIAIVISGIPQFCQRNFDYAATFVVLMASIQFENRSIDGINATLWMITAQKALSCKRQFELETRLDAFLRPFGFVTAVYARRLEERIDAHQRREIRQQQENNRQQQENNQKQQEIYQKQQQINQLQQQLRNRRKCKYCKRRRN